MRTRECAVLMQALGLVVTAGAESLFNGKGLTGWHKFLKVAPARGRIQLPSEGCGIA